MNPLTCEACGSNDIIKQNGLFVCQHCGTKYTVDEVRSMYSRTQLDRTSDLEKYLKQAEICESNHDFRNAYKYYSLALEIKPDDWFIYFKQETMHYEDFFFTTGHVSALPKIAMMMPTIFCTTFDMILNNYSQQERINECIKAIIHDLGFDCCNLSKTIERKIYDLKNDYEDMTLEDAIPHFSEYIECFNGYYEDMFDKVTKTCRNNSELIEYAKQSWLDFLEEYGIYFVELDAKSISKKLLQQPVPGDYQSEDDRLPPELQEILNEFLN